MQYLMNGSNGCVMVAFPFCKHPQQTGSNMPPLGTTTHAQLYRDEVQILDHTGSLAIAQLARPGVTHPAMNTTATREHPQAVPKAEIVCSAPRHTGW